MELKKVYEDYTKDHQLQVIEVVADVNSEEEAATLGYEDFQINLYINHKYIGDISHVLAKTDAMVALIDETDWLEMYCNQVADAAEGETEPLLYLEEGGENV